MANYFLKNQAGTKMYRLVYDELEGGGYALFDSFVMGKNETPSYDVSVNGLETRCNPKQIVVDLVLQQVLPGTVAEYRALAKSIVDDMWSA